MEKTCSIFNQGRRENYIYSVSWNKNTAISEHIKLNIF